MNRRESISALVGLGLIGIPADAASETSRRERPVRIGLLPDFWDMQLALFREAMLERGWREKSDYVLLFSGAPAGQIEEAAQTIIEAEPDLIYVANTAYALAAHRRTKTVPIVMLVTGFPVEAGLAQSLARPGKNVTGNAGYAGVGLFGKLFELLCDAKPSVKRIGVLWSYVPPAHPPEEIAPCYLEMREAAQKLRVEMQIEEIARSDQVPPALVALESQHADALFITSGPGLWLDGKRIMDFATRHRVPTIADWPWFSDLYPLITYSPTWRELTWQAVAYVDRVLKGERPGDLPLQQPAKYELVLNTRTARAIGLTLPQSLLLRADRVTE